MATKRFVGGAVAVAQVDDFTPSDPAQNDTFTLTVTGENGDTNAITITVGATHTVAAAIAAIVAAWNASAHYLCTPITASDNASTTVKLTADTAGVPFTVAATCSAGTFTRAATTANAGPYDYKCTGNWLGGVVPATGDTVYIDNIVKYGLDNNAVEPAYLKITKQCGQYPTAGLLGGYLKLGATITDIDLASGGPVLFDNGAIVGTITVFNSPAASATGVPVVWLKANEDGTNIIVRKGVVGIGWGDGETTKIHNLDVLYTTQKSSDATVYVGALVDMTSGTTPVVSHKGGNLLLKCAATTVNSDDGALTTEGSGAITTLNIKRSTVVSNSTGTITAANIESTGILDTTKSNAARTITTVHMHAGATFKRNSAITVTNAITFDESVILTAQAA